MLGDVNRVRRCNYLCANLNDVDIVHVSTSRFKVKEGSSSDDGPSTSADTSSDSSALFLSPWYQDNWSSSSSTSSLSSMTMELVALVVPEDPTYSTVVH